MQQIKNSEQSFGSKGWSREVSSTPGLFPFRLNLLPSSCVVSSRFPPLSHRSSDCGCRKCSWYCCSRWPAYPKRLRRAAIILYLISYGSDASGQTTLSCCPHAGLGRLSEKSVDSSDLDDAENSSVYSRRSEGLTFRLLRFSRYWITPQCFCPFFWDFPHSSFSWYWRLVEEADILPPPIGNSCEDYSRFLWPSCRETRCSEYEGCSLSPSKLGCCSRKELWSSSSCTQS